MQEKGHWYTDKQGNHYFVKEGETPKEGWEVSKRRKMINNGKHLVSEDGSTYKEANKDDYDKYEADVESFDDNNDEEFEAEMKKAQEEIVNKNTMYNGAEVIGGDNDNESMLKDKTPLSEEESKNKAMNAPSDEKVMKNEIKLEDLDLTFDFQNEYNNREGKQEKSFNIILDGEPVVIDAQSEESAYQKLSEYLNQNGLKITPEELKNFKNNQKSSKDLIAESGLNLRQLHHSNINEKMSPKQTENAIKNVQNKLELIKNNLNKFQGIKKRKLQSAAYHLLANDIDENRILNDYESYKDNWIYENYDPQSDLEYEEAEKHFENIFGNKEKYMKDLLGLIGK